ncbi:Protein kinase domain [Trypanosoma vivax]|uniref:non-specific serine/threonine protein kinase n=1 Tax=Trypanosoma vivax (strain Y486) TaxID=1055687 RepID=G0U916_TRYVY|nr:putative serine/threonine-protein kinase [Trypanosoma vivax]KAH8603350.1 Protein kinase domain [Trypanosoma vivax]CCC54099.1 putative serine/threonine-protein kinase [Trypanosoma vivax Y486]
MGAGASKEGARLQKNLVASVKAASPLKSSAEDAPFSNDTDCLPPLPLAPWGKGPDGNSRQCVVLDDVLGDPSCAAARYWKREIIGKGAFGDAHVVERNPSFPLPTRKTAADDGTATPLVERVGDCSPKLFVAKVVELSSMSQSDRRYTQTEIMCLANSDHFAIVKYVEHFVIDDEDETIVIITELVDNGDMHQNLYRKTNPLHLSEREAGCLFVQLLLGLDHIHRRRMIHRDIKTANIFLSSKGFIKLGDFGFSKQYDCTVSNPIASTFLGTSYYLAPEILQAQRYGKKADIWAAGVVLCELLGNRRPFEADSLSKLKDLVLSGTMWLPAVIADGEEPLSQDVAADATRCISSEMRDFLQLLLQQDPAKRPSASELLKTRLMQHYLCLFKKRVNEMFHADDALEKRYLTEPKSFSGMPPSYSVSMEDRARVLQGIEEGEAAISTEAGYKIGTSSTPRMESVVFKASPGGQWKERYLILSEDYVTITLTNDKVAAQSGKRSRRMPLETIKSVVPLVLDCPVELSCSENCRPVQVKYAFALSTQHSQFVMFATSTEEERDQWLSAFITSLNMG